MCNSHLVHQRAPFTRALVRTDGVCVSGEKYFLKLIIIIIIIKILLIVKTAQTMYLILGLSAYLYFTYTYIICT